MSLFNTQNSEFHSRHIGTLGKDAQPMLDTIGVDSLDTLINNTVPAAIRLQQNLKIPAAISEVEYLNELRLVANKNKVFKTYIGMGYYNTITPSVIARNVFENPGWYTQYTPYQAEIAQGRLESLLNFQTMVADLTGLPLANASLLDEATAAAEAMNMLYQHGTNSKKKFFVDANTFPQTIDLLKTRSTPIGIELVIDNYATAVIDDTFFGAFIQYPNNVGSIENYTTFINTVHSIGGYVVMATDLLALTLLASPGDLGADVAIGSAQRFGVPLGFGGPHAAFFATKDEFKRGIPGRIMGISIDAQGNRALRMALQTREQHIKREKATSNICTAQALLANMAAMYAVYHGPQGLKNIATRVAILTQVLSNGLKEIGFANNNNFYFDTIEVVVDNANEIMAIAQQQEVNFRKISDTKICISLDETTTQKDVLDIVYIFANSLGNNEAEIDFDSEESLTSIPNNLVRTSTFLTHPVFNSHHSESQMMRYIKSLENKDLSLNTSMISLGSCTMKLNAASEMIPLSWPQFSSIHPFVPTNQVAGYLQILNELSSYLCTITGFDACSLQPNSGAQGEYAGLLTIMDFHKAQGNGHRNVVIIPISAHGTNPASAIMAGMQVVVVKSNEDGTVDFNDLVAKVDQHKENLGGLMVTYPSTYGVFEENIKEMCQLIHDNGGQVYMDGANMNAQVGLTSPANIGADVCHLNLHKTFAIPHGGGGPGMGPICVKNHLAKHLPGHLHLQEFSSFESSGAVSAAQFGSASILLISYGYIKMLGYDGVKMATEYAILNANYMKARLEKYYTILYTGKNGHCAHEFIVDLRPFKILAGIEAEDVAKRLIDFGFHAPTMSFPVAGTIMIEPTESEDKPELDRFCDALIAIYHEIKDIETGKIDKLNNPLKNAPHTQAIICADEWNKLYSRSQAAFPLPYIAANKFWPSIARVNNTHGDRNLICSCQPIESYMS
jgi:glycine dehydrogenase